MLPGFVCDKKKRKELLEIIINIIKMLKWAIISIEKKYIPLMVRNFTGQKFIVFNFKLNPTFVICN